jgi:hypothetical protein
MLAPAFPPTDPRSLLTSRVWMLRATTTLKRLYGLNVVVRAVSPAVEQSTSKWLSLDKDPRSNARVKQLLAADDEAELQSLMSTRLAFGNAPTFCTFPGMVSFHRNVVPM